MTLTLHDRLLGRNKKREGVSCDTPSFLFYPMQLVTPSVVAIAVRMLLALRSARSSAYLASSMLTKEAALLLIIFSIPYIYIQVKHFFPAKIRFFPLISRIKKLKMCYT